MEDKIEITTPSGKKAIIRNYTTHGDDLQAEKIINAGITATTTQKGEPTIQVSVEASAEAERKYVELLVETIDGEKPDFEKLRSEDYAVIAEAVREISSPKGVSKS
jgi:hypothetical protein